MYSSVCYSVGGMFADLQRLEVVHVIEVRD
jgi:hypothetical protein